MLNENDLLTSSKTKKDPLLNRLDWDSNFFAMEVGVVDFSATHKLDFNAILLKAKEQKLDLVYLRSRIEISNIKDNFDLQLVDKKVTYTIDISKIDIKPTQANVSIFPIMETPPKVLIELSFLAGNYSRFKVDKKI